MLKGTFVLIKPKPKTNKSLSEAVAGDLLCYNNDKLYIYPSTKFEGTPIGVVVVPTSHNVYGNGSCGVMSLVNMSCDTPDTGTTNSESYIIWGSEKTGDITTLSNYDSFVHLGNSATISETIELQPIDFGYTSYLPSDGFTTLQNPYDTDTYYSNETGYHMPSPYNEDDSRNPQYSQTSAPSNETNALSDFNGKGNTEILTNLVTAQTDWKTASTIRQYFNSGVGYFPAACCCWRFHTLGTKQGDWYLPAIGELGYIIPKLTKIDSSIPNSEISTKLGNEAYWSSTETSHNGGKTWFIQTYDGKVVPFNSRIYGQNVRAFMQAGPDIVSE